MRTLVEKVYNYINRGNEYLSLVSQILSFGIGYYGNASLFPLAAQTLGIGGIDFIVEHEASKGRLKNLKGVIDILQFGIGLANLGIAIYQTPIVRSAVSAISPETAQTLDNFIVSVYGPNPAVPLAIGLSNIYASSITIEAKTKLQTLYDKIKEKISSAYSKIQNSEVFETFLFGLAGANNYIATNNPLSLLPLMAIIMFEKITDYSRLRASENPCSNKIRNRIRQAIHNFTYPATELLEITAGLAYLAAGLIYTPLIGDALRAGLDYISPGLSTNIDQFLLPYVGNNPMTAFLNATALFNAARYEPPVKKISENGGIINFPPRERSNREIPSRQRLYHNLANNGGTNRSSAEESLILLLYNSLLKIDLDDEYQREKLTSIEERIRALSEEERENLIALPDEKLKRFLDKYNLSLDSIPANNLPPPIQKVIKIKTYLEDLYKTNKIKS